MLFEVEKERPEGLKYNIDFWGRGGGRQGEGIGMSTLKCLNTFVPHCSKIVLITSGFEASKKESHRLGGDLIITKFANSIDISLFMRLQH